MRSLAAMSTLVLLASACVAGSDEVAIPPLDADRYALEVQPFVAASCATLDCHGERGRPLRLYSVLGLRIDDTLRSRALDDDTAGEPLLDEELESNVLSFATLNPELASSEEELIVSKPLARAAGGSAHVGGGIFDSKDAPGYLCLLRWLRGHGRDATSCADALDELPTAAP